MRVRVIHQNGEKTFFNMSPPFPEEIAVPLPDGRVQKFYKMLCVIKGGKEFIIEELVYQEHENDRTRLAKE